MKKTRTPRPLVGSTSAGALVGTLIQPPAEPGTSSVVSLGTGSGDEGGLGEQAVRSPMRVTPAAAKALLDGRFIGCSFRDIRDLWKPRTDAAFRKRSFDGDKTRCGEHGFFRTRL